MGAVMRPIPMSLLASDMVVRRPANGELGGEYGEPSSVEHVRFVESREMARRGYVLSDGAKGLVYVDAANSTGDLPVPVGSLASIDGGEELAVLKSVACPGFFGVVHHWELEVG